MLAGLQASGDPAPMKLVFSLAACLSCVALVGGEDRRPADDKELRFWLENMIVHHGYSDAEASEATGMSPAEIEAAVERLEISRTASRREPGAPLRILPYPGGRHPRIGFLDGAVDPQRDTKVSVFTPWDPSSYVVVDLPEAIWSNLGLTYLAHTHIDTIWAEKGIELPKQEWHRLDGGVLKMERSLPNGIRFGARISPDGESAAAMELWIHNGTDSPLTELRAQVCVMLKGAKGFAAQSAENKTLRSPFVACRSDGGGRWIITAWHPCHRPWQNPPVPCLHSDPSFPDCPPGETVRARGKLWFYEGDDVVTQFRRFERNK